MTAESTDLTVRRSVTVAAPLDRAFRVFTAEFDSWWPREHHVGKTPLKTAVIEGKVGGRCYGLGTGGDEADWGRVLVWEPPRRLVIGWHLNGDFSYDPDPAKASEVEVRFIAEGPSSTRVELEHRHFERHGATAEKLRLGVGDEAGWGFLLGLFGKAAQG